MTELIVYSLLFVAVMGHCLLANKMYKAVHLNQNLKIKEKNDWKFKALLFPAYFWGKYKKQNTLR
jgi:hypothetical protein